MAASEAIQPDLIRRLKAAPMSRAQILAAVFCAVAIVSDGYDTVSMSLAAPFVLKDFGVGPRALGIVFSAVALGMVAGAFLGSFADQVGRRTVIIAASAAASVLMFLTGTAGSVIEFVLIRFLVGCAVGAMVTCLNIAAVEYANDRLSGFFLSIVHVGIGIGAMLGSAVAILVVGPLGWRWIFYAGAGLNAAVAIGAFLLMPESLEYLVTRQPRDALARVNRILARYRHPPVDALPPPVRTAGRRTRDLARTMGPTLIAAMALLACASFAHFLVAYFHNSWAPKLLIDAGLDPEVALSSGIIAGVGSLAGNLFTGVLSARFDPRKVTAFAFAAGAVALVGFGFAHGHAAVLLTSAGLVSLFSSATNTGVYLCAARTFPAAQRGFGVGIVAGIGRIGAVIGPSIGGSLIALGWGRSSYYPLLALLYLCGALAVWIVARRMRSASVTPISAS